RSAEESGGPGNHDAGSARTDGAGDRPDGRAAREPRQEEARAGRAQAGRGGEEIRRGQEAAETRPARRAGSTQGREEIARALDAPVRRPGRREAATTAAQYDPLADRSRLRLARARPAQLVAVLVPGPHRAAHRGGARGGQCPTPPDHPLRARGGAPTARIEDRPRPWGAAGG